MNRITKFIGSSICAAAFLFVAGQVSAANLVLNPGFETGDTTSWLTGGTGVGASITVQSPDNGPSAPGTNNCFMTNSIAASNLYLQQSTALGDASPGLVNYSFDMKGVTSAVGGVFFVHIWDINSTGGVIDQGPGLLGPYFPSTTSWTTITGSFTAPSNVNHLEIEFDCTTGAGAGSAEAVRVDNVSLTQAVPEPTTVALVGLGLFGTIALGRKRKS
jgi:PEP-CTERM motif-containing protein